MKIVFSPFGSGWLPVLAIAALSVSAGASAQVEVKEVADATTGMTAEEIDEYVERTTNDAQAQAMPHYFPVELLEPMSPPTGEEPEDPPEVELKGHQPANPLEPNLGPSRSSQIEPQSSMSGSQPAPVAGAVKPSNYGINNLDSVFHYTDHTLSNFPAIVPELRSVGRLIYTFDGSSFFTCTASLIAKSILVTAGHCVAQAGMGQEGYLQSGYFMPAYFQGTEPFGRAQIRAVLATSGWISEGDLGKGYDVALVVLDKPQGQSQEFGDLIGWNAVCTGSCMQNYWYLTQLGYPCNMFDCREMIMGQHLEVYDPSQLGSEGYVYGSGQQGGSSGGPHVANWGQISDSSSDPGQWPTRNVIFAVTSWGYTNESIKIQGSSPLTGPKGDDPNNFRGMYNSMCEYSRGIHGANSCELLN